MHHRSFDPSCNNLVDVDESTPLPFEAGGNESLEGGMYDARCEF